MNEDNKRWPVLALTVDGVTLDGVDISHKLTGLKFELVPSNSQPHGLLARVELRLMAHVLVNDVPVQVTTSV